MPATVPTPSRGFGSDHNYFLYNFCNPITNLTVTIEVTENIIGNIGCSFQLNCYSPANAGCVWQQYGFLVDLSKTTPTLTGFIDNWPSDALRNSYNPPLGDLINHYFPVALLPGPLLPAGYKLVIGLENDANGNVTAANYSMVDNRGGATSQRLVLESLHINHVNPPAPVKTADLAPIVAFQLNLVGPDNGVHTQLSSGAGTFTYTASNPLMALGKQPACTAAQGVFTEESANSVYGPLSVYPLTQTFKTAQSPPYTPGGPLAVSQRFGAEQTDLYAVDGAGQLAAFSVKEAGHWTASPAFGPSGLARPGAPVAATRQFGATNQTDVFMVGQDGALNMFSSQDGAAWTGPVKIGSGKSGVPTTHLATSQRFGTTDQTGVFFVGKKDKNTQLLVNWIHSSGASSGPDDIGAPDIAPHGCPLAASQRFGIDQTDVFLVDNNGQLNVFWIGAAGGWNGPHKIGPVNLAPKGAQIAVAQQYQANQTNVFVVDNHGQMNVFWVDASGAWNGPEKIGPAGFAPAGAGLAAAEQPGANRTDVFVVDNEGQLNLFWNDGSTVNWGGPEKIGSAGIATAGASLAASHQSGVANRTDVFVLNETGANSPGWPVVFWVEGSGSWNGPSALVIET